MEKYLLDILVYKIMETKCHIEIFVFKSYRKMTPDHEHFMRQALVQAQRAFDVDEVPVGAVVVMQCGRLLLRSHLCFIAQT